MQSSIMLGLPTHLVQKVDVGFVGHDIDTLCSFDILLGNSSEGREFVEMANLMYLNSTHVLCHN